MLPLQLLFCQGNSELILCVGHDTERAGSEKVSWSIAGLRLGGVEAAGHDESCPYKTWLGTTELDIMMSLLRSS
jgi:hypothetical protein